MKSELEQVSQKFFYTYLVTAAALCLAVAVGQYFFGANIFAKWFMFGAIFSAFNLKFFAIVILRLFRGTTSGGAIILLGIAKTAVVLLMILSLAHAGSAIILWVVMGYLCFVPAALIYSLRGGH